MDRSQPVPAPCPIRTLDDAWELVRSVAPPTPLRPADSLAAPGSLLLKREDLGPNGSFKWRGALCAVADLAHSGADQVVTASTGNHGAATAWAARIVGLTAHVVVPSQAGGVKCALIERNRASLHRVGADLDQAAEHARTLASHLDAPYLEDGASWAQLLGAGTIARELVAAEPATVIAPLAVGALVAGLGLGIQGAGLRTTLYGVQADGFDAVARRLRGVDDAPTGGRTFADGLADNRIVDPAFAVCRRHLSGVVVASEQELQQAVIELYSAEGIVAEGAGAAALAGFHSIQVESGSGSPIVLVISGRNLDQAVAGQLLGVGWRASH